MRYRMLKCKLHRAVVTAADLDYVGSISIDPELMLTAGIVNYEQVTVLDINNGARFETYAMAGDGGQICLNGAAARLVQPGDRVIILAYADMEAAEAACHEPTVVLMNERNEIDQVVSHRSEKRLRAPRAS